MPDYGQELQFGAFLTPSAADVDGVIARATLCDQLGLDLVTCQDHPYQRRFLETWTLLAAIAARTLNVRVAPNVANLAMRPPAVLAKSAATLDLISGGRVELGLGAGGFLEAVAAYGGPRWRSGEAVRALEEGIDVIRAVWDTSARSVRVEGAFHSVVGAHPGPAPAHRIEIWLGAYRPRMLALTGRRADGWLPSVGYAPPEELGELAKRVDEAAAEAGRPPEEIRRLYNINGSFQGTGLAFLQGTPTVWVEQLTELTLETGTSVFILGSDDPDDLRRFAMEVAPAVRDLVAAERTRAPEPPRPQAPTEDAFTLAPTADDGTRLSDRSVWDETDRPTAARRPPVATSKPGQAAAQLLVEVHDHLRHELATVRDLIDQVARGATSADAARSAINDMTVRQNNWTLGAYCESYCRVVTTHHTLEDQSVFPHLRRGDHSLAPVLDRLHLEHEKIHGVLDEVDAALVAFIADPTDLANVRAAVDLLSDALLSHLAYEERELLEPLSRFGFY